MGCANSAPNTEAADSSTGSGFVRNANKNDYNSEYTEHTFSARWEYPSPKEKLGEGAFSEVYLVINKKTGMKCAAKVMKKSKMNKDDVKSVHEEVRIMRQLQHPNIVKFVDLFDETDYMYVILEFLEGGALFDRVVDKDHYNERDARDLVFIFLSSLKFCHDRDIIHRDIKPENLLMSSLTDDASVKIADFGLSIHLPGKELCMHACGTPNYIAPEMIFKTGYSKPVDMWAVGCIAFILLGGYLPFDTGDSSDDPHNHKLYTLIKTGRFEFVEDYWGQVSDEAKNLIKGLLTVDPHKRMTVEQALAHPWVSRAGSELAARSLASNMKNFKAFLARRKFRGAVKGVIATNKFKNLIKSITTASKESEKEKNESSSAVVAADIANPLEARASPAKDATPVASPDAPPPPPKDTADY